MFCPPVLVHVTIPIQILIQKYRGFVFDIHCQSVEFLCIAVVLYGLLLARDKAMSLEAVCFSN
jgi:hypothetical protein